MGCKVWRARFGRCRCPRRLHRRTSHKIRAVELPDGFFRRLYALEESGKLVRILRLGQAEQREVPGEIGARLRIGDTRGPLPCLPHTQRRLGTDFSSAARQGIDSKSKSRAVAKATSSLVMVSSRNGRTLLASGWRSRCPRCLHWKPKPRSSHPYRKFPDHGR